MDKIIYGLNLLDRFSSKTVIVINNDSPIEVFKIKTEYRSIVCNLDPETVPSNQRGLIEYLNSTDTTMKYLGKEFGLNTLDRDDLQELIESLKSIDASIEREYPTQLEKYKELSKTVKLHDLETIKNFPSCSDEIELYNLREYLIRNGPIKMPGETDEQLIVRLRDIEGVPVYRSNHEIPKGKLFKKSRELLKAINRRNKQRERERKLTTLIPKINQSIYTHPLITNQGIPKSEIMTPGFIMEIVNEPSSIINTPSFVIEIVGMNTDLESNVTEDWEANTDHLQVVTWKQYYHVDKDIKEFDPIHTLNIQQWSTIDEVCKLFHRAKFVESVKFSNREEYLYNEIVVLYNRLKRRLPETDKIPIRKVKSTKKIISGAENRLINML